MGRISNGDDFWSKVDAWFEEEIRKRDRDLSGPLWRRYSFFFQGTKLPELTTLVIAMLMKQLNETMNGLTQK